MQKDIDNLMIWLDMNNLNVNASKSSCMVLSTRHNVRDINITIDEDSINVDNDVMYKIYMPEIRTWSSQISGNIPH